MRERVCARLLICASVIATLAAPALAQTGRVTLDVVGAIDGVAGSTPARNAGVWVDVFGAVRLADGLDFVVRPLVTRRTFDGEWQKQMYQLGVRYERPGRIGLRVEAGQLPSPIGIAMLENRPELNPLVSQHSAYYLPLPAIDPEIPRRTFLIGAAYPFGGQVTLAGRAWDARVAIVDSSPVRGRPFFDPGQQPRMANAIAGIGITPRIGLRLGAAFAHGGYVGANELADPSGGDRDATLWQVEGEWSFGYTRLVGEWVHTTLETGRGENVAHGGWVEIVQTVTPRLFIAGRADSQQYHYQRPVTLAFGMQRYERFEAIAGFRLTPDLTLRGGYMVRKGYVVNHWDDQLVGSIVWQRRLW